jgi:hypothetical protein
MTINAAAKAVTLVPQGDGTLHSAIPTSGASLLFRADFLGGAVPSEIYKVPPQSVATTTVNAYGGSDYSLRGNLKAVVDPITGLTGSGVNTADVIVSGLISETPIGCYVRWRFRMDNVVFLTDALQPSGAKVAYLSDTQSNGGSSITTNSFWPVIYTGVGNLDHIGRNYGGSNPWFNEELLAAGWPQGNLYGNCPNANAVNGQWNLYEAWFDYQTRTMNVWLNEKKFLGGSYFTDGQIPIGETFHFDSWRFWHVNTSNINGTQDANGEYAAGYLLDDIEIWDGLPEIYSGGRW